ncbi:hypothetical protein C7S18_21485 [Ahniella affigens]|uniref:Uncharacterized protein n=1 Tax=Ahniella affigens TaxID=2021234 RepID=A0A2P1PXL8_9GAMM|nr:hypothetical protein C7S18_21485 [Ahniella affigens]
MKSSAIALLWTAMDELCRIESTDSNIAKRTGPLAHLLKLGQRVAPNPHASALVDRKHETPMAFAFGREHELRTT